MTIQVKISHGDAGHPAPLYVSKVRDDGVTEAPMTVRDGDTLTLYVHSGVSLLVSDHPPKES